MTGAPAAAVGRAVHEHWDVAGPAGAPVILFVHGTKVTRNMWHPQFRAFADRYRMVALDLPAHGSRRDDHFRMGHATDQVRRAIDEACGGSAIVVGQSLGGYIAMLVAARNPEAINGLVLSNCSAEPRAVARHATGAIWSYLRMSVRQQVKGHVPGPEEWPEEGRGDAPAGAEPTADASGEAVRTAAAAAGVDGWASVDGDGAHADSHGRAGSATSGGRAAGGASGRNGNGSVPFQPATRGLLFRGSRHALTAAMRTCFRDHLAAYPGSTLILNGERDEAFRRGERAFLGACRDGRLVVVPGAGHLVNIEGAAAYNAALVDFVESVQAGRLVAAPVATDSPAPPETP